MEEMVNTKLNNWFITPNYKPEYGVYSEFNSFKSYTELIGQINELKFCFGYAHSESIHYLSNSGYLSGDSRGRYTYIDKIISPYLKKPFPRRWDGIRFTDLTDQVYYDMDRYNITPFYYGCGDGDGRGTIAGCGYDFGKYK